VWLFGIVCSEYRGARLLPQSLLIAAADQAYPAYEHGMKDNLASGSAAAG
jgi:hypothetical protein